MKKMLLLLSLMCLTLISCNNYSNIKEEISKDDMSYLKNIVDEYNDEESLSFENYFINQMNLPLVDNKFSYNNKDYKIENNDVLFLKNSEITEHSNIINSFAELKNPLLHELVYVKSVDTEYEIIDKNDGLDIPLDNNLFARPVINDGIINVKAFGASGNGIDDDSIIINKIFANISNYKINVLIFPKGNYLCKNKIELSNVSNLKIIGNDSKLIVNDSYNDEKYSEFFFNIYKCDNLLLSNLGFFYEMKRSINGIKTQLGVHRSNNIEFFGIKYDIPSSTLELNSKDREFTNMDLYTNWENIIINKCSFTNVCDSSAGGSLWIRDFHGIGSKNCKVLNSKFYKIAHDEIIAVFKGTIDNVLIKGNEFVVPDDMESSSVMNFTLGTGNTHTNIIFLQNTIDTCATGGLIWAKGKNVIINNNDIKLHLSKKATGNFRAIEAQKNSEGEINKITEFKNNNIEVDSYLKDYSFQVHILNNIIDVSNNKIIINLKTTDVFLNVNMVDSNDITINDESSYLLYNISSKTINNNIMINGKIGSIFRYYGSNLNNDVLIKNNNINYNYQENENDNSCLIMLNDLKMNGHKINFELNNIKAKKLNKKSRMLFYAPNDLNQESSFINNIVEGYNTNTNYLKNCNIIFLNNK